MKKILIQFQYIGKTMSKLIVTFCLLLVYVIAIMPYTLFIRFNRVPINRNKIFNNQDFESMF